MTTWPTELVGREEILERLEQRLESDAAIITLVGAPGVGKSALARHALRETGVSAVVCELSAANDVPSFQIALARALGVETDGELAEALSAALRRRQAAVLLDGFDQLVSCSAATILPLADEAPGVLFVVTSRERLGLAGEEVIEVGPLAAEAAVELFERRASGTLDGDDLQRAGLLVERLDFNPLAIELAAARTRTFTPADLLEHLDRRFALLRSRTQASLQDAIALSWDLLDDDERGCLAQAAVFVGGFDLAAAESVVVLDGDSPWVLDVIESLLEKSLLGRGEDGRLRMGESIRAYVAERGDISAPQRRHASYFGTFASVWNGRRWTAANGERAGEDLGNLIAVIDRFERVEPQLAAHAALAVGALLRHRGLAALHDDVLSRGIAAAERAADADTLAKLLQARGELGVVSGRLDDAARDSRRAAETSTGLTFVRAEVQQAEVERRTGHATEARDRIVALLVDKRAQWTTDSRRYAEAHLASCHVELGELAEARELLHGIAPPSPDTDDVDEYLALKRLAYAHYYLGNFEQQHRLNAEALAIAERVGDRRRVARARQGLGDAAFARSDFDEARREYEVALTEHRELGNDHLSGVLLGNLGGAEHRCDALETAAQRYHEALLIHRRAGAIPYEAVVNFALGVLEHERAHFDDAGFHYSRAAALFDELGQVDDLVATQIAQAWLAHQRRDRAAAITQLDAIDEAGEWLPVIELSRALVEAREPRSVDHAQGLVGLIARGLHDVLAGQQPTESDQLRASLQGRLLLRLNESLTPSPVERRPDVLIGENGQWFQTVGDVVNLRRRKAHRRILDELAGRQERGDEPLDVYDAFDLGWPGEEVEPEVAAERVYWVVGVLRRLGLDGILMTSDAGYYLDSGALVQRATDPE